MCIVIFYALYCDLWSSFNGTIFKHKKTIRKIINSWRNNYASFTIYKEGIKDKKNQDTEESRSVTRAWS